MKARALNTDLGIRSDKVSNVPPYEPLWNKYAIDLLVSYLFLGICALFGGYMLIADPSGAAFELPLRILNGSPFDSYLIPGWVLFLVFGVGGLACSVLVFVKPRKKLVFHYSWNYVFVVGYSLLFMLWMSIQFAMIGYQSPLQLIFGLYSIGMLLNILSRRSRRRFWIR